VNEDPITPARGRSAFNVPNLLSVLRLPIAGAFFVVDSVAWRGVLLTLAALSDALDGWLARQLGQQSEAGAVVDPAFDKLFVTVVLTAFLVGPDLDWPEFLVMLSRDLYVSVGFLAAFLLGLRVPAVARLSGKAVTALQVGALFVLLFWPSLVGPFVAVVGVASAIAIIDYTAVGVAALRGGAEPA
jgi:CDP-diacylglycerol--glycerol-3-phosphate 3-phosphatidyltransferase/cardiolipin synthase